MGGAAIGLLSYGFFAASFNLANEKKPYEAFMGFVAGSVLTVPSGIYLWFGGKKIWDNYSSGRVNSRFDRHDAADKQVSDYLDEVFNTKESDIKTS